MFVLLIGKIDHKYSSIVCELHPLTVRHFDVNPHSSLLHVSLIFRIFVLIARTAHLRSRFRNFYSSAEGIPIFNAPVNTGVTFHLFNLVRTLPSHRHTFS